MGELEALRARLVSEGSLSLAVKVIPKSSRTEFAGRMGDGTLKIKVAAVPEKGKANAELCRFLARLFQVPAREVTIRSGHSSPRKIVQIIRPA